MQSIYPGPDPISDEEKMSLLTNKINTIYIDLSEKIGECETIGNSVETSRGTMSSDLSVLNSQNTYSKSEFHALFASTGDIIQDVANKNVKAEDVYTKSEMGDLYESRSSFYDKTQLYSKDEMTSGFLNPEISDIFYTKSEIDASALALQEEVVGVGDLLPLGPDIQLGSDDDQFQSTYIAGKLFLSGEEVSLNGTPDLHVLRVTVEDTASQETCSLWVDSPGEEKSLMVQDNLNIHEMYRTALDQATALSQIKTQLNIS